MSEKSKGDTSRIIKNPLLSASVTGLTFEDFPNKPLLLPAAPPVIPVSAPEDYTTISEDHQKSVTVGQTPEIDTETLSEINLNTVADDEGNQIDLNDQQISQKDIQDGSLLSQAASSFSQLPTVASTVFSTFSKVIKEYTPSGSTRESSTEKEFNQQSEIITETSSPYIVPPQFSDRNENYQSEHNLPEPPKLYSPTEVTLSAPPTGHQPHPINQNTYRLSAKKKTYAQIPGLSLLAQQTEQQQQFLNPTDPHKNLTYQNPSDDVLNFNAPSNQPEITPYSAEENKSEERKGLSLLSSFVPPVWQNITDLVQSSISHNTPNGNQFSDTSGPVSTELNTFIQTNQQTSASASFNIPLPHINENSIRNSEITSNPLAPNTSAATPVGIFTPPSGLSIDVKQQNIDVTSYTAGSHNFFAPPLIPNANYEQENTASNQNILYTSQSSAVELSKIPSQASSQIISNIPIPPTSFTNNPVLQEPTKPPTGPIGGQNFRLQKGTRLYKSPFNPSLPTGPAVAVSPFVPTVSQSGISTPFGVPGCYPVQQTALSPPGVNKNSELPPVGNVCPFNLNASENLTEYRSNVSTPFHQEISNINNTSQQSVGSLVESVPLFSIPKNNATEVIENKITKITPETSDYTATPVNRLIPSAPQTDNSVKQQDSHNVQSFFNQHIESPNIQKELAQDSLAEKQATSVKKVIPVSALEPAVNTIPSRGFVEANILKPTDVEILNTNPFQIGAQASTQNLSFNTPEPQKQTTNLSTPFSLSTYFNQSSKPSDHVLTPGPAPLLSQTASASAPIVTNSNPVQGGIENLFRQDKKLSEPSNENTTSSAAPIATVVSDPLAFFDSFHPPPIQSDAKISENISEDSNSVRIQDFFNNPPQSINDSGSDLNYKLVGSGVTDKRLENLSAPASDSRALSPISNIVEPPSSSCSEFSSEFTAKIVGNLSSLNKEDLPDELLENFEMAGLLGGTSSLPEPYKAVSRHWFYKKNVDSKQIWTPFSFVDSKNLEDKFLCPDGNDIVQVEGGRYDVSISERTRAPAYWAGEPTEVRRCSWFYKAIDSKYVPYEEAIANLLEEEYREASESGEWHRKIALPTGETVVFHGPSVIVHFLQSPNSTDAWATSSQTPTRPRVVKRDIDDFSIEPGESERVDHLLFMVHGVGSACDLRFRSLEEVVEEFRIIANQLIQAHYKNSYTEGTVGRVEVLPVSWHSQLHSEESGIDEKLKAITLESIPKLRNFTNDTLLDILFYTSPIFCQNIMSTVAEALNKTYIKYCQRNPSFKGGVSLAGHSLGSLILFDLLCHQKPSQEMEIPNSKNPDKIIEPLQLNQQVSGSFHEPMSQQVSYTIGPAGTGQPYINYPQLIFHPKKFFALGSPIGMFVTIRGIDTLGLDFKLPTCTNFFHIFHPYDPVAYRIEALINPDLSTARPVLIPHHKGRKRMHLELKETMSRVGADLKQRIVDTFKNTLDSVNFLGNKNKTEAKEEIAKEVDKVLEMQLDLDKDSARSRTNSASTHSDVDAADIDVPLGKLNDQRRIDYVLQEAPLEFFNEYLFAFASHVCYWDSEDTILFIMKEIYSSLGIRTDIQVPQQSMTIERPLDSSSLIS